MLPVRIYTVTLPAAIPRGGTPRSPVRARSNRKWSWPIWGDKQQKQMTVYKTLRALFCAIEWHKKVPIKGLEKGDGVPSSPCGLRRDKLGREKGPILM